MTLDIESYLHHISVDLSHLLYPFCWLETLLFALLGQNTTVSFRMFPPCDVHPDFPAGLAYVLGLYIAWTVPNGVICDEGTSAFSLLGKIFLPVTRRFGRGLPFSSCLLAAGFQRLASMQR